MHRVLNGFLLSAIASVGLLAGSPANAGDAAAGKASYDMYCASCHGASGKGDGPAGAALNPKARDFTTGTYLYDADGDGTKGTDADLALVIKQGAMPFGGSPLMTPWGAMLDDAKVGDVVAYIRSMKK